MLDYVRYQAGLTGTKIGCREGDCGACTILVGEIVDDKLIYKSVTSCLMPIGNARNRHIVTIEGINATGLTPIQQCFSNEGATQCGFCTPGFIVSLTGYCLNEKKSEYGHALDSINGNICRCTGYKSIERAVASLDDVLQRSRGISLASAIELNIVPPYFADIESRLKMMHSRHNGLTVAPAKIVGGGTDLYVQQHEAMIDANIHFINEQESLKVIRRNGDYCEISGNATVTDLAASNIFQAVFSDLNDYIKLISSTQIRNMATVAGNFCNASPIGDLTIFFLALNAKLIISNGVSERTIALEHFYKAYKVIDLLPGEFVASIAFKIPNKDSRFNFEKVSKRTHLDIASVNTALYLEMDGEIMREARLSAGGVGPVPLFMEASSDFLKGKIANANVVSELVNIVQKEISPISDARGSAEYKRLLLSQLIKAHFTKIFPSIQLETLLTGIA